jgi:hypothetical protein
VTSKQLGFAQPSKIDKQRLLDSKPCLPHVVLLIRPIDVWMCIPCPHNLQYIVRARYQYAYGWPRIFILGYSKFKKDFIFLNFPVLITNVKDN